MRSPLVGLIAFLLSAAVVSSSVRAQTSTLIDTFGPGNTFTTSGTVAGTASTVNAVRFTVPAGGNVTLVNIDMALGISGSVTSAQIGIFNESAGTGLPVGMPIVSAPIPGPLTATPAFVSTPFPPSATLIAGRNYWVAPFITGTGSIFWAAGLSGSTSAAFFSGSTWAAQSPPSPLSIRITVNGSALSACCNARGTGGCIALSSADCAAVGGVAGPAGTACAAADCTNLPGACCRGTTCTITTAPLCLSQFPARFLGAGVSCQPPGGGPNVCCPADINNSGSVSVQDIFDFLSIYFAGC